MIFQENSLNKFKLRRNFLLARSAKVKEPPEGGTKNFSKEGNYSSLVGDE